MDKEELTMIIERLIQAGEDREELEYWTDIFYSLPEEEQEKLAENLRGELEALQ